MSTKKNRKITNYTLRNWGLLLLVIAITLVVMWTGVLISHTVNTNAMRVATLTKKCDAIAEKFGASDFEEDIIKFANESGVQIIIFGFNSEGEVDLSHTIINTSPYSPSESNVDINVSVFYRDMINNCMINMRNSGKTSSCDIYQTTYYGTSFIVYYNLLEINDTQYLMYSSMPMVMIDDSVDIMVYELMIVTIATSVILIVISFLLIYKNSKTINTLSQQSMALQDGNYDITFEGNGCNELDTLAESLNYAKTQLSQTRSLRQDVVANVSHDLKTPLTLIKSYAELLKDFPNAPEKKRTERLDLVIAETDRMTELVNEMLRLAQSESGVVPIKTEKFDLSALTKHVVNIFQAKEEEGYVFEVDIEEGLIVKADKSQIEKVLQNYVQNAVNYTGKDKKVKIYLGDVNGVARFDVFDTGKGISDKDKEKIWDRYYRASIQYSRGSGTGLGLSIVKNILIRHGFNYGVNSVVGKGSDFFFEIPIEEEELY